MPVPHRLFLKKLLTLALPAAYSLFTPAESKEQQLQRKNMVINIMKLTTSEGEISLIPTALNSLAMRSIYLDLRLWIIA